MYLKNPFPLEVRLLYLYNSYECWDCGGNGSNSGGIELHHIWGRISASALNSAPMCKECHNKIGHTREEHQRLLRKTIYFLSSQGYKLKPIDDEFLETVQNDLLGFTV